MDNLPLNCRLKLVTGFIHTCDNHATTKETAHLACQASEQHGLMLWN